MASQPRRIVMIAFPGAQILDVTGPLEVFSAANDQEQRAGRPAAYRTELVATRTGPIATTSGVELLAQRATATVRGKLDTLLVAGGEGTETALGDASLIRFLRSRAPQARRVASVCTGAFLLARAGLLKGRRATTHWSATALLSRLHPEVQVEADAIYVRDGRVWTSAGVTAGMDLTLALVEEDLGRETALAVARRLVLFLRRPGGQSQFSAQLQSQLADRDRLREVQSYVLEHPEAELSVDSLARRAGMSPRKFARVFSREVGCTPGRFVEEARVEAARRDLEDSDRGIEAVASRCGFGSAETMRRAFLRCVSVPPAHYRERFRNPRPIRAGRQNPKRHAARAASRRPS
jgi:transcriptional regulator GlxA family with amidase domain